MVYSQQSVYRGRFAPSPTGPLHFGSLVAATASFLEARSRGGEWHVRIDDLDTGRTVAGAADDILRTLEAFGLHWDGPVVYQSARNAAYRDALQQLQTRGHLYACACSRREIAAAAKPGVEGLVYPGTCRERPPAHGRALRVRVDDIEISFHDRLQGPVSHRLAETHGDFVLRRADGLFAYQLAVVVDDAALEVTEIVRGADLLKSTPRQIHLQQLLGLPTPRYVHVPVAVDRGGIKLSKQSRAAPVNPRRPLDILPRVLRFLGQPVPSAEESESLDGFWRSASTAWRLAAVPGIAEQRLVGTRE